MNKNNGIKLTKKELLIMANDLGVSVEEIKLYLKALKDINLIEIKNNNLTLTRGF